MSHDPQVIAEARALMACIRVTRDPEEQNRLWNRYYRISDEVFPEAAVLRNRYRGMTGAERQRFKTEYMELVRRLWLATDPETAFDEPFSRGGGAKNAEPPSSARAASPPRPKARQKKSTSLHGWAIAAVGVLALVIGGSVWGVLTGRAASFFQADAPEEREEREAEVARAPVEDEAVAPPSPGAPGPAPESAPGEAPAPPPASRVEDPVAQVPPPAHEVPVAEIEAELAAEIKPVFTPVPPELKGRGDSLRAADQDYTDVYVIESDALYFVRIPETGAVASVSRAGAALTKSTDEAGREALLELWYENKGAIARAEKKREEEKVLRIAARRKANEYQAEKRREALEEASWEARADDWRKLAPEQRHGARLRAYSDWRAIQTDAESLEELYRNIARTYEYIGVNDSRMAALNKTYRQNARTYGPDYEVEDAFMVYGWGREEILRQLAEWEAQYYKLLEYVNEHYPVYEARIKEIEKLDETLPESVRVAEATGNWGDDPDGRPRIGVSFGTGFIVADAHVMTCAHVVSGGSAIRVTSSKGKTHDARIVASDPENDWCLLEVEGLAGKPIPMATGTPNVGATIYCLGFPLGGIKDSNDPIVGSGNVAALQRIDGDNRFLQITAPINPGNSGGPVLDQRGQWVGIVSQKLSDLHSLQTSQSVAQGLNYAVKATHVQPLLNRSGATVRIARGGSAGSDVKSLEDITRSISPSIVKIEVE